MSERIFLIGNMLKEFDVEVTLDLKLRELLNTFFSKQYAATMHVFTRCLWREFQSTGPELSNRFKDKWEYTRKELARLEDSKCLGTTFQGISEMSFPAAFEYFADQVSKYLERLQSMLYNRETIKYNRVLDVLSVYLQMVDVAESFEQEIQAAWFPEWESKLFDPTKYSKGYKNSNYLVSFIDPLTAIDMNYPVISCSYVTDGLTQTYNGRKYGFLFYPTIYQVVGMCPDDMYCSVMINDNKNKYEESVRALHLLRFVDEHSSIWTSNQNFQVMYKMDDLAKQTRSYNEVLLNGKTKPAAVFVFDKDYSECKFDLMCLCYTMKLPLVIAGTDGRQTEMQSWQDMIRE